MNERPSFTELRDSDLREMFSIFSTELLGQMVKELEAYRNDVSEDFDALAKRPLNESSLKERTILSSARAAGMDCSRIIRDVLSERAELNRAS